MATLKQLTSQFKPLREGFNIRLAYDPALGDDFLHVYFVSKQNGKTYIAEPIDLVFKEHGEGLEPTKPTISFNSMAGDFIAALEDVVVTLPGHKEPDQAGAERELTATRRHLDDMRQLAGVKPMYTVAEGKITKD